MKRWPWATPCSKKRCFQKIERLLSDGVISLLFVSHDQEGVRTLTNRAVLLKKGLWQRMVCHRRSSWSIGGSCMMMSRSILERSPSGLPIKPPRRTSLDLETAVEGVGIRSTRCRTGYVEIRSTLVWRWRSENTQGRDLWERWCARDRFLSRGCYTDQNHLSVGDYNR